MSILVDDKFNGDITFKLIIMPQIGQTEIQNNNKRIAKNM